MLRTLEGWLSNAFDRLALIWGEPLSLVILIVGLVWIVRRRGRQDSSTSVSSVAGLAFVGWLIAALAITVYPLSTELESFSLSRFEIQSAIPLAGTIESIANSGDRIMSPEEYEAARQRVADDFNMPLSEVKLDRYVHGPGTAVLKDPIGNVVLFIPLGIIAPFVWKRARRWTAVGLIGGAISAGIELSQLLFGLGSLGTIDDVIFNTAGTLLGYGMFVGVKGLAGGLRPIQGGSSVSTSV